MRYVCSLIFAAMFCFSSLGAAAASTVEFQEKTITGSTPITAQLSTETFSTRALENALHKLVIDSTHKIKSFSVPNVSSNVVTTGMCLNRLMCSFLCA